LSVSEANFRAQMEWLEQCASVVSLDELLDSPNRGGLRVALSFDDGYRSLHDVAHPILAERGFPAIVYLNSGLLGESAHPDSDPLAGHYPGEQFMTWGEVSTLVREGWTAGGHGVEHLDLTETPAQEARWQLAEC
jgi:peptidoglycan/xylan/chitin deacetylase (PgdA/CDA1 family)